MFGFVTADLGALTKEEQEVYQGYYCGLCHGLKAYKNTSRLTLNYDMTFLYAFLSSYFDEMDEKSEIRCPLHPLKKRNVYMNKYAEYASAMNIILAYHKLQDDWQDDKNLFAYGAKSVLETAFLKAEKNFKEKSETIKNKLFELYEIEKSGEHNADIPAKKFGEIMGVLFDVNDNDPLLYSFGESLGKVIYIMDACVDFKSDIKRCRYNPMVEVSEKNFQQILTMLLSDCTNIYGKMNIVKNKGIFDNVLYSGIWRVFWRKYN